LWNRRIKRPGIDIGISSLTISIATSSWPFACFSQAANRLSKASSWGVNCWWNKGNGLIKISAINHPGEINMNILNKHEVFAFQLSKRYPGRVLKRELVDLKRWKTGFVKAWHWFVKTRTWTDKTFFRQLLNSYFSEIEPESQNFVTWILP